MKFLKTILKAIWKLVKIYFIGNTLTLAIMGFGSLMETCVMRPSLSVTETIGETWDRALWWIKDAFLG